MLHELSNQALRQQCTQFPILPSRTWRSQAIAAALSVIETPGFTQYELIPDNWWVMGILSGLFVFIVLLLVVCLLKALKAERPNGS